MVGESLLKFLEETPSFSRRLLSVDETTSQTVVHLKGDQLSFRDKLDLEKQACEKFPKKHLKFHYHTETASKEMKQSKESKSSQEPRSLPQVQNIIAVTSAKGGVGKSTVAAHLALALKKKGLRVGLLDSDVYGPSLPTLFQVSEEPQIDDAQKLIPHERMGIKLMSFGFFVPSEAAVMWRGPLVHKALQQLFFSVRWGSLDCLIIDMPPGTGDAHLNLLQNLKLTGTLLVTTPHDLAFADLIRGFSMYRKLKIPVLGIVENMSYYVSPQSKEISYPFESNLLKKFLVQNPILHVQIPLHQDLARSSSGIFEPLKLSADAFDPYEKLARSLILKPFSDSPDHPSAL
jgi:ATP-binding protein involved in chromosome partitioning